MCDSPDHDFKNEDPTLISQLAHYVLIDNFANFSEKGIQQCWRFKRLSLPIRLAKAGFTEHSNSYYQKLLLNVRRWMTSLRIFDDPDQSRVYNVFYTKLGLALRKEAVENKHLSLRAFKKAFICISDSNNADTCYLDADQGSLTILRFILIPELTCNEFAECLELANRISQKEDYNPNNAEHIFISKMVKHFETFGHKKRMYYGQYHLREYGRLTASINYLYHPPWEDRTNLRKAAEEILNFLSGQPAYCNDFASTKKRIVELINSKKEKALA